MTSSSATRPRPGTPPDASRPADEARARRAGILRLAASAAASPSAPMTHLRTSPRAAIRVAALRAVLEVAGPRRGAGRVLSRGASDADIGREVRRALAACGRIAVPTSRSHDLIHPRPAFCDGAWTKARRPVRLARVTGRGPLPDRVRAAGVRWIGDALLLTPRARHGVPLPLARLALRATAPDEDLGAALRQALALGR